MNKTISSQRASVNNIFAVGAYFRRVELARHTELMGEVAGDADGLAILLPVNLQHRKCLQRLVYKTRYI